MYFCTEILNAKLSLLIFDEMFTSFQSISQWLDDTEWKAEATTEK